MSTPTRPADVVVVGGGVVGWAVAWRAAQAGLATTVVDPEPGRGASHVAAGMLAPVSEAHWGEEALLHLNLASAARWPAFAQELAAASGADVGFGASGTLVVGLDGDDLAVVEDLHQLHARLDLPATRLRSRQARQAEPLLAPGVRGGLDVAGDHHVDPRAATAALQAAATAAGVALVRRRAVGVTTAPAGPGGDLRATGVVLDDGTELAAGQVVAAAGAWTAALGRAGGLPPGALPPVRPVKGQVLVLAPRDPDLRLSRVVRGWAHGGSTYLVPRADGRVVVGATQEEQGFDTTVTAGAVHDLLRDATALVPALLEHELREAIAGLRPATPDNAPAIGPAPGVAGLVVATGHHRNGVLLAPVTGDVVARALATGTWDDLVAPFSPARFAPPSTKRRSSVSEPLTQPRRFEGVARPGAVR